MERIAAAFAKSAPQAGRGAALIAYIVAGDPAPGETVATMRALAEAGADVLELGVPFSDPMADGPSIQRGCERALAHGTTLADALEMTREFRADDARTPVVLMGYRNPVEAMGAADFAAAAAAAGVDGVLTVDLPPEEAAESDAQLAACGIAPIRLLAPTTPPARVQLICEGARGFLYYVSFRGVTGANRLDLAEVERKLAEIRRAARAPLAVGFGVRDARAAAAVAAVADGVVVGSALVDLIGRHRDDPSAGRRAAAALIADMRAAMDAAPRAARRA